MTNTPTPLDPIAQIVAKYQSNGQQTTSIQQQPTPQPQQKESWTGFAGKTLWDWLNLLGVLLVPLILGAGTILITVQQSAISQSQRDSDQRIADNQFQESLLKTFRDDINRLIFDQHLLTAKDRDPVQIMAQSYTNDALRKLDQPRRTLLVQFLSDLELVTSSDGKPVLISLSGVNLRGINPNRANLSGADLKMADLSGANLSENDLSWSDLNGANLSMANLSRAYLNGANLSGAKVTPEQLAKAKSLKNAILPDGSRYPSSSYPIPNHQEPPD